MSDHALQDINSTVRLPLYGEERHFPGGGRSYLDQRTINGFINVVSDHITGEKQMSFTKRPGLHSGQSLFSTSGAANHYTLHCKDNIVITQLSDVFVCALFDSVTGKISIIQYRPDAATSTKIGEISNCFWGDAIHITEYQQASGGNLYPAIAVSYKRIDEDASGSSGWYAISNGTVFTASTLTEITHASFPTQLASPKVITGPFQQMNGLIYIMTTDGTIYNSGSSAGTSNDITLWNTLSNVLTYQSPDKGIGIYRYKHHLVAFSKNSIEFFNDEGLPSPGTPLLRTQQAYIAFGTVTSKSVININDVLYWISYGTGTSGALWKMAGYTPVKVSRQRQDNQITTAYQTTSYPNIIDLFSLMVGNKMHLGVNFVGSYSMIYTKSTYGDQTNDTYKTSQKGTLAGRGSSFMYSIEDDLWWNWQTMQETNVVGSGAPQGIALHPAVSFAGSRSVTGYNQYILIDPVVDTNTQSNARVFVLEPAVGYAETSGVYRDDDPDSGLGAIPISIVIQLNTANFLNENRKRINRVSLIFSVLPYKATADTGTYSISLLYSKSNRIPESGSTLLTERYISYPNSTGRYYWNNLGMARFWSFSIVALSKDPFPLFTLELDIDQGIKG